MLSIDGCLIRDYTGECGGQFMIEKKAKLFSHTFALNTYCSVQIWRPGKKCRRTHQKWAQKEVDSRHTEKNQ
ncbi:hypothetical protein AB6A40_007792 [Gnathostoma spinigerum]|uniref:Uncharacterized protein n=1 Tax=Gnathostoma spinigerum TaxID=75299 RepID=A0ABD6EMA1_9BILA